MTSFLICSVLLADPNIQNDDNHPQRPKWSLRFRPAQRLHAECRPAGVVDDEAQLP